MKIDLVDVAYNFAKQKHRGQKDDTGADYFEAHVLQVYHILRKVTENEAILAAGLLHDTIEDTTTNYDELKDIFGQEVADLVYEVTHEPIREAKDGHYFPRLKSQNAIMIKLADRLSNVSRMQAWNEKRREKYLAKTKFWKPGNGENK